MSSLLQQLDEKVAEIVNTGAPADIPAAETERTFALAGEADLPAICVRRLQTIPRLNLDPNVQHAVVPLEPLVGLVTTYAVDCFAKGKTADADPMVAWVWRALNGQTQSTGDDPRLFYQIQLRRVVPNVEQSDHPYAFTRVEFDVFHQTRADDPEAWE